ncbi:MAG TPA: hypothetical protein VIH93_01970 [Thermoanaerobaculia bacterium]|jgi:hypothetical protein
MPNVFQVVVLNYPILHIRPPRVCDISPGLAGQVINFVGLESADIERSLRAGEVWDATQAGKVLSSVGAEKAAAKP